MAKFGAWKLIDGEEKIPLRATINLSKGEILSIIHSMLSNGKIPNNKTEIMDEAYRVVNSRDNKVFKVSSINPLTKQLFDEYFKGE